MPKIGSFWNARAAALLKNAMEDRGIGVEELAKRLQVDPRTIRNWLRTEKPTIPSVDKLPQLCSELGVTLDYFREPAADPPATAPQTSASPSDAEILRDSARHLPATPARRVILVLAGIALVALAALMIGIWRSRFRPPAMTTFAIPAEVRGLYDRAIEGDVSPDGEWVLFQARYVPRDTRMLFVYSAKNRKARPLPMTAGDYTSFFWSADSRSIFYISESDLMKVTVSGDAPERIAYVGEALKGTANAENLVVLGSRKGLIRVSPSGTVAYLTRLRANEVSHSQPLFLPDGERVLFTIAVKAPGETLSRFAAIASVETGAIHLIGPLASRAQYVNGLLLYVRDQILFARPFNAETLRFSGDEQRLAFPIWTDKQTGEAAFSASPSLLLVMPPQALPPLYHVGADGRSRTPIAGLTGVQYLDAAARSDELAVSVRREDEDVVDLWLQPLDGRPRVRLLAQSVRPTSPVFSPDDRLLYYADTGTSWANIYVVELQPGGTPPRPVLQLPDQVAPRDVSPDGRFLLFQRWHNRDGAIWYMPVGDPAKAKPLIDTPEDEVDPRFSPDGTRVSYVASRGGTYGAYLTDFPPTSQLATPAAAGRASKARWSRDGRRMYVIRDKSVLEVDPATRATRILFEMPRDIALIETARDGGFFVRETPVYRPQTLVASWALLAERPLHLTAPRDR